MFRRLNPLFFVRINVESMMVPIELQYYLARNSVKKKNVAFWENVRRTMTIF